MVVIECRVDSSCHFPISAAFLHWIKRVGSGIALFQHACKLDLEGIVAKQQSGPYVTDRESSTWFKILNREYSQRKGREELFERDRRTEPVPGWHSCAVACKKLSVSNAETS